jgi:hypothetical protein
MAAAANRRPHAAVSSSRRHRCSEPIERVVSQPAAAPCSRQRASSAARSVIAGDRARVYSVLQWDACWKQATSYCATTCELPELSPPWLVGFA